jgi:3-oxoacyl-[acyl-carrier-protein] synthase-3
MTVPARLTGIGHYFPGEPVTNEFFAQLPQLAVDDEWIRRHTGIRSRHWPTSDKERPVEMGTVAANLALADAGLDASDVDLLIGTTSTTRARANPSSATNRYMDISLPMQRSLGAHRATAFDVTAVACAGFLYASSVASAMLASTGTDTALVVCAENPRPILNLDYRHCVLFGAAAAAAVWQRCEPEDSGLLDVVLRSDGRYFDAFDIDDQDRMIMRGKQIGEIGPAMLSDAARSILARNGLTSSEVDWFVPHQGNLNMIEQVAADLRLPRDRVLTNIEHRGNTSSAGIPGCLSEAVSDGTVKPGDLVLALGIGRGFSWGAMLLRPYCGLGANW